jgi:predicted aldo/keto reductase-like oxidoreductase
VEYRKIPHGNDAVSTVGLGGSNLHGFSIEEMEKLLECAIEEDVNLIDTAVSYAEPLDVLGKALNGRRDKFLLNVHLGLTFPNGQYVRTRDSGEVKRGFELNLASLRTDYADIGFIHYVDDMEDFEEVFSSGVFDYASNLRNNGAIRYLGFASHNVDICRRFLETGQADLCMFSVNAAYDIDPVKNVPFDEVDMTGREQLDVSRKRALFYQECVKLGVGIMVMKPYGGGVLLDSRLSPFGKVMTIPQCLQYALDRPAVISCLLGVRSRTDLTDSIRFYSSTPESRDYSFISGLQHRDMRGTCVYCNHCLPCPAEIDIAAVHKYFDLFKVGDVLAKEHYMALRKKAKDCIECGSCEGNCPFQVNVREKMRQAVVLFGE